jgi:hypothetical protein
MFFARHFGSDPDDLEDRIRQLRQSSDEAAIEFVFSELTVGITNVHIARLRAGRGLDNSRTIEEARNALQIAEKYMWQFKMRHPEFDQMIALAERLRFELNALHNESDDLCR